ncbi:MAG: polymer-forming cytoskeletal protein [Sphingobacteriales bacterium]|jgi:cytoskeletal protein CcmA (bactofilin family)|nr:polymer-forming cytoskeletal protein [Sphingobacteriales bacterium]
MAIFNPSKNSSFNPQDLNILNAGTKIQGDLSSEGDLRIDGGVKGNIDIKTKLVLGVSSQVDGNIKAQNCDISGVVNGNIEVSELLTIKASAKIKGDISCCKLIIESGAIFNGKSSMVSDLNSSISDYKSSKFAKPLETKAPVVSAEKASI